MTSSPLLDGLEDLLGPAQELYTDIHAHPELSMREHHPAALAAERLDAAGLEVTTGVGTIGVVGVLRSGDGLTWPCGVPG
jgi:metal-dependent amidase/aminoacylase/carboxypeptidase family protein